MQAMHALFEDIHVDFKFSAKEQSGSFAIYSMQIDNQLLTSSRPVVLSHDPPAQVIRRKPPPNMSECTTHASVTLVASTVESSIKGPVKLTRPTVKQAMGVIKHLVTLLN